MLEEVVEVLIMCIKYQYTVLVSLEVILK